MAALRTDPAPLLNEIYERLFAYYGPQHWWPGESPLEIAVGALLTQQTVWRNAEAALDNLKHRGLLTVEALDRIDEVELAALIRPAGFFKSKARKIKALIELVKREYGGALENMADEPLDSLRGKLLATHGIGPETADAICLYVASKPTFVVDAYAIRILRRIGVGPDGDGYEDWRHVLLSNLPADRELMNEYHALLVAHGKLLCRKSDPRCLECPLLDLCRFGQVATSCQSAFTAGAVTITSP
jgi:endonuclease III related protein